MTAITAPSAPPKVVNEVAKPYNPGNKKSYKLDIVWFNVIGFAILHLATLYGWYLLLFGEVKLATKVWVVFAAYVSVLGTTVGAHRLFTHKCFKANQPVRTALLAAFTMAGQNCLWVWTRDHRQHHKYSDTDGDPHNASRGFFFSHIGWLMVRKQPEVIELGKLIDMSDMNADPMIMFQKRYYKTLFTIFSIAIPTLVPYYFWNEDLWVAFVICFVTRLMSVLNGTWLVNSAAHIYGNRPFSKDILPTENSFVSFIGMGEGWHNYHHSFPWDYKAAELGKHFNFSATLIEFFAANGWAWDLKGATPEMVKYRATKRGDGTHPKYSKKGNIQDSNNNDWLKDSREQEQFYEQLKTQAETQFDDDNNNNEVFQKRMTKQFNNEKYGKKEDEHERQMKGIIQGIYKLVD